MKKKNIPQNFCHLVNGACLLQKKSPSTTQKQSDGHFMQGGKSFFVFIPPYYAE